MKATNPRQTIVIAITRLTKTSLARLAIGDLRRGIDWDLCVFGGGGIDNLRIRNDPVGDCYILCR